MSFSTRASTPLTRYSTVQRNTLNAVSDDGRVSIDEVVTLVNIVLDHVEIAACRSGDIDTSGTITINEVVGAVNRALRGC